MGARLSQEENLAKQIVNRVWEDDPSTKQASVQFAHDCLTRISELIEERKKLAASHDEQRAAIDKETTELLRILDNYLADMVKKLYLQFDHTRYKFDHPLLFRFWRWDERHGKYVQTRSGRGLSITSGIPRAENVLTNEALLQELEKGIKPTFSRMAYPEIDATPAAEAGQQQNTPTPTSPQGEVGESSPTPMDTSSDATSSSAGSSNTTTPSSNNSSGSNSSSPPTTTQAPTRLPWQDPNLTTNHRWELRRNSNRSVPLPPPEKKVGLVFRGEILHPNTNLYQKNMDGGVLDLILLRENEKWSPDLIDDSQVRMLSAHSSISQNARYLDLLYALASRGSVLPFLEADTIRRRAHAKRTACWRACQRTIACIACHGTERFKHGYGRYPVKPRKRWQFGPKDVYSCVSGDNAGADYPFFANTGAPGFDPRKAHAQLRKAARLEVQEREAEHTYETGEAGESMREKDDPSHSLLPLPPPQPQHARNFGKRMMLKFYAQLSAMSAKMNINGGGRGAQQRIPEPNAISRLAWSTLTSLRDSKCYSRLLADLFEEKRLEIAAAVRHDRQLRHLQQLRERGGHGPLDLLSCATTGLVHNKLWRPHRSPRQVGTVEAYVTADGDELFTIHGGLPRDLADLIDDFLPNKVQCVVMEV